MRTFAVVVLCLVAMSCASPYDDLTDDERAFVIPGTDDWGDGRPCADDADCAGPTDIEAIQAYDWAQVESITTLPDEADLSAQVVIGDGFPASLTALATINSDRAKADQVSDLLDDGYEVWVSLNQERWMGLVVVFDDEGRFAAVGEGGAAHFTVPVARMAARAGATTGRAFLLAVFGGDVDPDSGVADGPPG